ncbi:hypothetical protein CUS58_00005, partial [Enterococcus faecium]
DRSGQLKEISAYFRRSYFWNTVYSQQKRAVTRFLSQPFFRDEHYFLGFNGNWTLKSTPCGR